MPAFLGAMADFIEKVLVSKWMRLVVVRLSARGTRRGNGRERVEGVSCFSGATVTIFAKTRDM